MTDVADMPAAIAPAGSAVGREPSMPRPRRRLARRYDVQVGHCGFDAEQWRAMLACGSATAFQTERWVGTWYATQGGRAGQALPVVIVDLASGELAAALPLVRRTDGWLRIVEFADNGVSDYNAPVLGPAAPTDVAGARAMWEDLRGALSAADLVRFTKMPSEIEGRVNPFALLPQAHASSLNSNRVTIEGSWEDYLAALERLFRKELRRSWRVFLKHEGATFRRVTEPEEAARVLVELERQQAARRREAGLPYILDRPDLAAFYRKLTVEGVGDGSVVLTALTCGDEVVAALLGVTRKESYVMIRISSGSREWANCSPGRLVIVQTMQMLHQQGYKVFDFSIGNYDYKRRLGVVSRPLCDFAAALSPRGLPSVAYDRAGHFVRRSERLSALVRRLRGHSEHRAPHGKAVD